MSDQSVIRPANPSTINLSSPQICEGIAIPAKDGEPRSSRGGTDSSPKRGWSAVVAGGYAVLLMIAGGVTFASLHWAIKERNRARTSEAALQALREQDTGTGKMLRPYAELAVRPENWDEIWAANYRATDAPEENLSRIYSASGESLRKLIDKLRADGRDALEILAALKLEFARE